MSDECTCRKCRPTQGERDEAHARAVMAHVSPLLEQQGRWSEAVALRERVALLEAERETLTDEHRRLSARIVDLGAEVERIALLEECNARQAATIRRMQASAPVEAGGDTFDVMRAVVRLIDAAGYPVSLIEMLAAYYGVN